MIPARGRLRGCASDRLEFVAGAFFFEREREAAATVT
jgi:hypothetical protein